METSTINQTVCISIFLQMDFNFHLDNCFLFIFDRSIENKQQINYRKEGTFIWLLTTHLFTFPLNIAIQKLFIIHSHYQGKNSGFIYTNKMIIMKSNDYLIGIEVNIQIYCKQIQTTRQTWNSLFEFISINCLYMDSVFTSAVISPKTVKTQTVRKPYKCPSSRANICWDYILDCLSTYFKFT